MTAALTLNVTPNTAYYALHVIEDTSFTQADEGDDLYVDASSIRFEQASAPTQPFTQFVRFDPVEWEFTVRKSFRYGLVYNDTQGDRSVLLIDFGDAIPLEDGGVMTANGPLTISFPITVPPPIRLTTGTT